VVAICHAAGGFLIRSANFAHLDNQSDSEKKAKRHSKALGEKRPNPVSFWFTAVGGSFFSDTRTSEWPVCLVFGLRMAKMAHIKPMLCVFAKPFYSSGYAAPEMHHQQANVIQTARAGAWPVWLIWYVPAAILRSRRAPKMLVGAGH
jgi:hypothetical protein